MSKYDDIVNSVPDIFKSEIQNLYSENSHLKKVNGSLEVEVDQLERRLEEYRNALRKCNPFSLLSEHICLFCGFSSEPRNEFLHTDDCEYMRLIGGKQNA